MGNRSTLSKVVQDPSQCDGKPILILTQNQDDHHNLTRETSHILQNRSHVHLQF